MQIFFYTGLYLHLDSLGTLAKGYQPLLVFSVGRVLEAIVNVVPVGLLLVSPQPVTSKWPLRGVLLRLYLTRISSLVPAEWVWRPLSAFGFGSPYC